MKSDQNPRLLQERHEFEQARAALDSRIAERTAELERANLELQIEACERAMMLDDLRASEERFRMLTALSSDWYWEQDAQLRFVQITEGAHNSGGIAREAHVGKRRWELPHTEVLGGDWGPHLAQLEAREVFHDLLLRRTLPDGERIIQVSGAPRFGADGTFLGYRGVARDITESHQAQRALIAARDAADAANRAKGEFLANMSHEIRTPLNGVLGMAGMLLESGLEPRQLQFARTIQRSAMALLRVINDILDFSKIEAGKLDVEAVEFDLREAVDETLQTFSSAADAKAIVLAGAVDPDIATHVRADPLRIRQILSNLIGNAIKFTSQGEVVLSVQAQSATSDATTLRFTVRDTGMGIEAEAQARIFDAFTQADSSTTRKFGGTGLGLTISRQLVQMMGGEIGVDSTPGQGSRFWFTLPVGVAQPVAALVAVAAAPLADPRAPRLDGGASRRAVRGRVVDGAAADGAEARPDARAAHSTGARSDRAWTPPRVQLVPRRSNSRRYNGHVLLVEDNDVNRLVAESLLESMGLDVDLAEDGEKALAATARCRYDLVLMDCQMPRLDGFATTAAIRAREGGAHRNVIVALTAHAMRGDRARCLAFGMDDYLSKPFTREDLECILDRWVAQGPALDAVSISGEFDA